MRDGDKDGIVVDSGSLSLGLELLGADGTGTMGAGTEL
jgi:hypothetical protein